MQMSTNLKASKIFVYLIISGDDGVSARAMYAETLLGLWKDKLSVLT